MAASALAGACGDDDAAAPGPAPDSGRDAASEDTGRRDSPTDTATDTTSDTSNDTNRCATGQTQCDSACVDTGTDRSHCGRCNNPCFGNNECVDGVCLAPCAVDQGRCVGRCVSLATDNANCGACGRACPQGRVCSNGTCALDCGPPLTTCVEGSAAPDAGIHKFRLPRPKPAPAQADAEADGAPLDAGSTETGGIDSAPPARYCANLQTDEANCGICGRSCGPDERCNSGGCALICPGGQTECSDGCHDLTTDRSNCGTCGKACPAGQVCSASQCQASCGEPFSLCDGRCVNTSIDRANCGDCNKPCSDQYYCIQGSCVPGCPAPGKICSDRRCHDVTSDNQHCGDCGKQCAAGTACILGRCELYCPGGASKCTPSEGLAYCARLSSDPSNCGTCGHACAQSELCFAPGICACPPGTSGAGCTTPLDCTHAACTNGSCIQADGVTRCACQDADQYPNPPFWNQTVRVPFSVTNTASVALPLGFTVSVVLNHQRLASSGRALDDGSNVHVVYTNGTVHTELDRMLHPTSGWNRSDTRLLFGLAEALAPGAKATYWLYYGGPTGTPPANPAKIVSPSAGWFTGASGINLVGPPSPDCFTSLQIRQIGRTQFELVGYDRTNDASAYTRLDLTDASGTFHHDFGDYGTFDNGVVRTAPYTNSTNSISVTMQGYEFSYSCVFFGSERIVFGSQVAGTATRAYTRVQNIPDPIVSLPCNEQRAALP